MKEYIPKIINDYSHLGNIVQYQLSNAVTRDEVIDTLSTEGSNFDSVTSKFFKQLKLFKPTTTIGHNLLMILFYPPTNCKVSKESFGNKTGVLLSNFFELSQISLIDVIPYLHKVLSKSFKQKVFHDTYNNNAVFNKSFTQFIVNCLRI